MNPRVTSIENLIATDPGGRGVFGLLIPDQLYCAAAALKSARRVGIVSGFFVPAAGASETDGPPGAVVLGAALGKLGASVDYITDRWNVDAFRSLGVEPRLPQDDYLDLARPTHLVAIERVGRSKNGRYHSMHGEDLTDHTAPLDALFIDAAGKGVTTIGIGDGGNEIGMGNVFPNATDVVPHGSRIACVVSTDYCIAAGVSNWGAYGLTGALSVLEGRDLLPSARKAARDIVHMVRAGHAVDGVSRKNEPTVDGLPLSASVRILEQIRDQIRSSPLETGRAIRVGILGYGKTGRSVARLLKARGHDVRVSDRADIDMDDGDALPPDRIETGGHTMEFLAPCELVVASPGVSPTTPIVRSLHGAGIPVVSELECAAQLVPRPMIAITGTVGKRTTLKLLTRLFEHAGCRVLAGGNRGVPLSALLLEAARDDLVALAVSSFQLESVTRFRPRVAAILNIDEAHLDRHRSIAEYTRIKSRIFMNQTLPPPGDSAADAACEDHLILPYDDPRLRRIAQKHRARTVFFSTHDTPSGGAWLAGETIHLNVANTETVIPLAEVGLRKNRIAYAGNLLTALIIGRLFNVTPEQIREGLRALVRKGGRM